MYNNSLEWCCCVQISWKDKRILDNRPLTSYTYLSPALTKKFDALAKEKGCTDLKPWVRSLVNHLYWAASSSNTLDEEVRAETVVAKWLSAINHIQDVHSGHSNLFPQCEHGPLIGRESRKKWLDKGIILNYFTHFNILYSVLSMMHKNAWEKCRNGTLTFIFQYHVPKNSP